MTPVRGEGRRPVAGPLLRVGAGSAPIALAADLFPVEGFVGVRDPLEARVVLLDDGEARAAVAVVDQTAVGAPLATLLRSVVAEAGGLAVHDVVLAASHTFSAPHVLDDAAARDDDGRNTRLRAALVAALRGSTQRAAASLRPGSLAVRRGRCDVNVNRDVRTAEGFWLGADDDGPSDKAVTAAVVRDDGGELVAVLVGYGVQPSVLADSRVPDGGRLVSADLAGAAMRHVERQYPGAVAMFLVGAAADQSPRFTAVTTTVDRHGAWHRRDLGEAAHALVDLQGERLGDAVVRLVEAADGGDRSPAVRVLRDEIVVTARHAPPREQLRPCLAHDWRPAGEVAVPLTVVRAGDLALACLAPELTAATGMDVVARSPVPFTVVVTMVDGAAKYMADLASFDRVTYEAMSSRFAPGSAEAVADRLVQLLGSAPAPGR